MLVCISMLEKDPIINGERFAETLGRYLGQTLHASLVIREFDGARSLPSFLARAYSIYETLIFGQRCVILAAIGSSATPSDISKHIGLVRNAVDTIVVFAAPSISAHDRSRLIGQGVPFVIPGNQSLRRLREASFEYLLQCQSFIDKKRP